MIRRGDRGGVIEESVDCFDLLMQVLMLLSEGSLVHSVSLRLKYSSILL